MYKIMPPVTVIVPLMQAMAIFVIINSGQLVAQQNRFRDVSSCVCPGCELVVECILTGGGVTVWQGTIFDGCQYERILLRHSRFNTSEGVLRNESCGTRGPIVCRSVSVTSGSFTSQLNVTFSEDLRGKTIECANESGQIVGSKQIDIPSGIFPPTNITLSEISVDQLTFTWDSISSSLSAVQYFVSASNCVCPNTTNSSSVRCNFVNTSNLQCSLRIQTVICGRIGSVSDPFIVALKVPNPPRAQIMQVTEAFALVVTTFNKSELISLSNGTTVSATSYTITYFDSSSGETCGSSTIPASSCGDRICSNVFEVSSTSCFNFSNIAVSFFASSRLGTGPTSGRTLISFKHNNDNVRQDYMYPVCMCFEEITFIAVGVAAFFVLALLIAVFVSVTAILIRSKQLIQKELNNIKHSQNDIMKGVYEEITLPASTIKVIQTNENAAYTCISRVCANSGL